MVIQPEETLGYWIARTWRPVAAAYHEALRACCERHGKPYAVTAPQYGVLALLAEEDGITAGAIADRRGLDPPAVTAAVSALERFGLVDRVNGREDRRVVRVHLTAEGRELAPALSDALAAFTARLTAGIPGEVVVQTRDVLHRILANVADDADIPGAGRGVPGR